MIESKKSSGILNNSSLHKIGIAPSLYRDDIVTFHKEGEAVVGAGFKPAPTGIYDKMRIRLCRNR